MVKKDFFVHKSSIVDKNVKIGSGTKIWHFCHILKNSFLGKNCSLGQSCCVGPNVKIGNNVRLQNYVFVCDGVELEDSVFCGPTVSFTNVVFARAHWPRRNDFKKTLVKEGATIGANSTILPGIILGKYCMVGAGSVVTHNVLDFALVFGNPARQHAWVCYCGEKIDFGSGNNATCKNCSRKYSLNGNQVELLKGSEK